MFYGNSLAMGMEKNLILDIEKNYRYAADLAQFLDNKGN